MTATATAFTIVFGWRMVPTILAILGALMLIMAPRDNGPFGDLIPGLFGAAFFFAAAIAALTGWLAS